MTQFTQREFLYLDDLLEAEHLAAVKARSASQQASDPQIRQLFGQLAVSHEQHFSTLLRCLDQSGTQAAATGASWSQQEAAQQANWQPQYSQQAQWSAPQGVTQPVQQRSNSLTQ